jgi:citrate synthase
MNAGLNAGLSASAEPNPNLIHTRIWDETGELDNAFATQRARCHGYDVYGAMLGRAGWSDMLFLLLRGEAPTAHQARQLDLLAVALANPGPRDAAVHAAMCGGVAGSTAAASLSAALAVGAGGNGGAREVLLAMQAWEACGTDMARWQAHIAAGPDTSVSIWPAAEPVPGFDPHGVSCATIVRQTLAALIGEAQSVFDEDPTRAHPLRWLAAERTALEALAGAPLAMAGVAAAALHALGFSAVQGEMLYLLLRLPGAAAHALEQTEMGFRKFPFYTIALEQTA